MTDPVERTDPMVVNISIARAYDPPEVAAASAPAGGRLRCTCNSQAGTGTATDGCLCGQEAGAGAAPAF